jgi:hypothetical protein
MDRGPRKAGREGSWIAGRGRPVGFFYARAAFLPEELGR